MSAGLILLIVVVGLYKGASKASTEDVIVDQKNEAAEKEDLEKEPKEEKLTTFADSTLGITFQYPSEWGQVAIDGNVETDIKTQHIRLSFPSFASGGHFLSMKGVDENTPAWDAYWGDMVEEFESDPCIAPDGNTVCSQNAAGIDIVARTSVPTGCDIEGAASSVEYSLPSGDSAFMPRMVLSDERIANKSDCKERDEQLAAQFKALVESISYLP